MGKRLAKRQRQIGSIVLCGWLNIRKWPNNPRIYVIALLVTAFLYSLLSNVRTFCADAGIGVTPWMFPFLLDDPYLLFIFMLGILLLFCDAPFIDSHQPNMIIRMGKTTWALGQIFYIMLGSALYFAAVFVISNLLMFPHIGFSLNWGQIIGTLAQTYAGAEYDIPFFFNYRMMMDYSPLTAMLWCFLLVWLIGVFLGLIHFVINQGLGRGFGTAAALVLVFLPFFAYDIGGTLFTLDIAGFYKNITLQYFSPVSWASLSALDITHVKPLPPRSYVLFTLLIMNTLLGLLAVLVVRRKSVEIMPPV